MIVLFLEPLLEEINQSKEKLDQNIKEETIQDARVNKLGGAEI